MMKSPFSLVVALALLFPLGAFASPKWSVLSQSKDLTVWQRTVEGSPVVELRARGRIDAPPERVLAVLADVASYAETMPHTEEGRLLGRNGNEILAYSVINPPLIKRRDYAVRIFLSRLPGGGYATDWVVAKDQGPSPRRGIVRIEETSGSWRLEPTDGGRATFATYTVHTDPGGGVPKWIVNKTQKTALPDIFAAVRKAVDSPRYRSAPNPYRVADLGGEGQTTGSRR